jgi:type I restriction enzyme M protein
LAQSYEFMRDRWAISLPPISWKVETAPFWGREKENLIYPSPGQLVLHGIDKPNLWHGNR